MCKKKKISVIIPCYNSEKSVGLVVESVIKTVEQDDGFDFEIVLTNDGSKDNTWNVISEIARNDNRVIAINLSQNYGQHSALMAMYREVSGDYIVGLDDDGEHNPEEMFKLIEKLEEGYDYVCADYQGHSTKFRSFGTKMNNLMARILIGKPKEIEFSSFFVMRRFVVNEIIRYEQPYPYVAGLLLRATRNMAMVPMDRKERMYGKSGYNLKKMVTLWVNGFTSFSVKPLRVATVLGWIAAAVGFIEAVIIITKKLLLGINAPGYASMMSCLLFCTGMIMIMLGVIGEYVGRIYISINNAPQYVIRNKIKDGKDLENNGE